MAGVKDVRASCDVEANAGSVWVVVPGETGARIAQSEFMNELEFKRHLKDLVHGHHHPEEHDWREPGTPRKAATTHPTRAKRSAGRKSSKRK
jgi:hypothetical protein